MPRIFNKEILSGTISSFGGGTVPDGWLLCNGSAVSRTVYAKLFAAIGTVYGVGDGVTTFNLPDGRGIFLRGAGTNGTTNYGGASGHTPAGGSLGNKGRQFTARNGLTASAAASSLSGASAAGQSLGSTWSDLNDDGPWSANVAGQTGTSTARSSVNWRASNPGWGNVTTNIGHSHSASSVTGTANAQTITVGAGDSETTPAFLAIHFIIKI